MLSLCPAAWEGPAWRPWSPPDLQTVLDSVKPLIKLLRVLVAVMSVHTAGEEKLFPHWWDGSSCAVTD